MGSRPTLAPPSGLAEVCRRYGVRELAVFGSQARGDAAEGSDLDLLYELEDDASLGLDVVDLAAELERVFGLPVDLVAKRGLKWVVRDEVLAEARVLYAA